MEEYDRIEIQHICSNICSGGTPKSTVEEYYGGTIPWLNTKEINFNRIYKTEKTITDEGLNNSSAQWIPAKSVIVAMYGATAGKTAITQIPLTTNQACCNLTIDSTKADYRFVFYALCNDYAYLASLANGGAQQNLNAQQIREFEIPYPSIEEQECIADILSSLDDKIELNRWINDNLEQQAQALFKSWFVNFEPFKNGQFVDSELGKIPKGWKVGYLSEIADIIMGQSPNGSTYNENGEGIIFYQGRAEFGTRFPSIRLFTTNPTRIAPANSILISVRAPVGDINITHKECCIGRGLASAVSRTNKSAFLLYTLFSLKSDLDRFNAEGTVFGSINRKTLESLKILIPTNDIISKFEAIVASMDQQILTLHLESENLKILRDTLLPKLMSGERSVIHKENNDD